MNLFTCYSCSYQPVSGQCSLNIRPDLEIFGFLIRIGSRAAATSKMEGFVIIVNS